MIAGVVLAAGRARRFGRQKLLADLGGRPIVRHAVEQVLAAGLEEVVVVLGAESDAVAAALSGLPVRTVVNHRYSEGMASSIVCGVGAVTPGATAIVIALGDQPTIGAGTIARLVAAWHESRRAITAPVYDGTRGTPVLFDAALRSELLALSGDGGARPVVDADPGRVTEVHFARPMPPDVDTPAALEELRRSWKDESRRPPAGRRDR